MIYCGDVKTAYTYFMRALWFLSVAGLIQQPFRVLTILIKDWTNHMHIHPRMWLINGNMWHIQLPLVCQLDYLFMLTLNIWILKPIISEPHGHAVLVYSEFNTSKSFQVNHRTTTHLTAIYLHNLHIHTDWIWKLNRFKLLMELMNSKDTK